METYNTLEFSKRMLKRGIKTETIKKALPYDADIVAGTTDYVDFLKNSRVSYYWINGRYFLETPIEIDIYLRTVDAPNSTSIILDSVRSAKIALNRGVGGSLISVSTYGYKRPPLPKGERRPLTQEAHTRFLEFIDGRRER